NGFQSYLENDYDYYTRFNGKIKWHPHKLNRLTLELAASTLYDNNGFQFYWVDAGHPYVGNSGVLNDQRFFYGYLDTKITYIDKIGDEHDIWGRFYRQKLLGVGSLSEFWVSSVYYNFRHDFGKLFMLRAGVNNDHYTMGDGNLGKHRGDYGGIFVQGRFSYKFLTLNLGGREEYVHEDSVITPTLPVFNAGASFEIRKYNNIRLSFSQSFRIASIAERYVDYALAGVEILPNHSLKPERGFTTELGYKRTIKIGNNFTGFFDASAFLTQFKDMIEFVFASRSLPGPPYFQPFFQSQNISKARIFGWELSLSGHGHLGPNVDVEALIGYTYFYGVNLNDTTGPNNNNVFTFIKNSFTHYVLPTAKNDFVWDSITAGMLKYRNPHQFKADLDFIFFKRYHLGTSIQYYSYMSQIDLVFGIQVPGITEYRQEHRNKGDFFWDLRTGCDFNRNISLNFIVKNVLNNYTVFRIARPDAPRSFTVQLVVNFGGMSKKGKGPNMDNVSRSNM
ncbi:MAG: hypothetical protein JWO06_2409, partial [Bacteroidota bacterium]|nr:hypothetical protein [Bacteroidota bacterium]